MVDTDVVSQQADILSFLEMIYQDQTGYSYSPYRDPNNPADWTQCYFRWPEEKEQLVKHIVTVSKFHDVYYSPALFSEPSALQSKVKTTQVLWAEFDGETPDSLRDIPPPTIKIQSSTEGHEHWYWCLDFALSNIAAAETLIRRITYATGADFCWNANRVLRPTHSVHHESGRTVRLLSKAQVRYSSSDLVHIPEVPGKLESFSIGAVPGALDVVAKYKWDTDIWELFKKKEQPEGSRSSALARLASHCIEMGMKNGETYAILDSADLRWKKFHGRNDRKERLASLVRYAIAKRLKDGKTQKTSGLTVFSFKEFFERKELEIQWIVPDLISQKSGIVIGSEGGVGKTQISMQMGMHIALGKKFIDWNIAKAEHRIVMLSLEMSAPGLQHFMHTMRKGLTDEEVDKLHETFFVVPLGEQLRFDSPEDQARIDELLKKINPTGVLVDSLGRATGGNINSDETVLNVFRYVDSKIKQQYNAFCWFIHHTRKPQVGNKRPRNLGDLYGNQYIGAWPDTAFSLWKTGDDIELITTKNRLGPELPSKFIKRTTNLNFVVSRVSNNNKAKKIEVNDDSDEFLNF